MNTQRTEADARIQIDELQIAAMNFGLLRSVTRFGTGADSSKLLPEETATANGAEPDPTLLKLLRRAHAWRQQLETGLPETISGLAAANGVNASYFTRVLRIAYLAPDIIEEKRKVDWAEDPDVQNQMKIAIEDELFALKQETGIELDFDTIDRLLDRVIDIARRRVP